MEHLTKQQIVLLTLLVSFVTAISTGIVVIRLTDQSSGNVTTTISHIIEQTVAGTTGSNDSDTAAALAAANSLLASQDKVPNAVSSVQKSVVTIKRANVYNQYTQATTSVIGLGLIISEDGVIVTDASIVDPNAAITVGNYVADMSDGKEYPLQIVQPGNNQQTNSNLVFLILAIPTDQKSSVTITPVNLSTANPRLGQDVIALSTDGSAVVQEGIIQKITPSKDATTTEGTIYSSIDESKLLPGSVLFTTAGQVLGIKLNSSTFYSASLIQAAIPAQ